MYWAYLILFTFIVFVPEAVQRGFYSFSRTQSQEFMILILGSLGFVVFLLQEKKLKKNRAEKSLIQMQVNRMTKDLTHSYSYIGEINRKLDILENIALGFPESSNITEKKQSEIYESIMGAIQLFGKSDEFSLRFIRLPEREMIKEIKSQTEVSINLSRKDMNFTPHFWESDEFIVTTSPKAIDNVFSCIIIRKKTSNHKIDDLEIMKTLAAQALFLYMFMQHKNKIKCVI